MLPREASSANSLSNSLFDRQADWLARYQYGLRLSEQGNVVSIGDGIAWISGLPSARMEDVVHL